MRVVVRAGCGLLLGLWSLGCKSSDASSDSDAGMHTPDASYSDGGHGGADQHVAAHGGTGGQGGSGARSGSSGGAGAQPGDMHAHGGDYAPPMGAAGMNAPPMPHARVTFQFKGVQ
jgi:hypothetical protein